MLWEALVPPSEMGKSSRIVQEIEDYELTFADGNRTIDLTSGLWNVNFGYGNRYVAERIEQVIRAGHYASLFRHSHPGAHEVAERLLARVGWPNGALVFSTSGSALNETIVKLASHWNALAGRHSARTIVSVTGSYHGMTLNSMQLSGEELNQVLYSARSPWHVHLPCDDPEQWEHFFESRGSTVGLVMLEPVLGSGAIPLPRQILDIIFAARRKYGFLVASDEVAVGYYRLGTFAASDQWREEPDIRGFSKALTNGTAASSVLVMSDRVARPFVDTDSIFVHGETQAGSPMATAAILGVLDYLDSTEIDRTYRDLFRRVDQDLEAITFKHGWSRRGQGLFQYIGWPTSGSQALEPSFSGLPAQDYFRTRGISVQPSDAGIQIVPPITLPLAKWEEAVQRLDRAIEELSGRGRA